MNAVTFVPNENGYTEISTQVGDTVYRLDGHANYKHTAHIVKRTSGANVELECRVWARYGTVASTEKDCFVWCENGCRQAKLAQGVK